jgi:hypothetical protein
LSLKKILNEKNYNGPNHLLGPVLGYIKGKPIKIPKDLSALDFSVRKL